MKTNHTGTPAIKREQREGERGSAILVAVMFMAVLFVLTLAAAKARVATARNIDSHETQQREYWGARSGAATLEASLRADIPDRFKSDLELGRYYAGNRNLPAFDSRSIPERASQPVIDHDGKRTPYPIQTCTSLLGQIDSWAHARSAIPEEYASKLGYTTRVGVFREAYRQQMAGSIPNNEPAYVLEFSIDAAAGENGHVRPSGTLMLGPAVIGCATAVSLEVSPSTVVQGTPASLIVTYSNASRITVTDSSGATVADQTVMESSTTEALTIPVTPSLTTTYTAAAQSSAGCTAISAPKTITVTQPPPQITFTANPACIVLGDNSTLSWTITGATNAAINGQSVNPISGTMTVTPNSTTTYTLVASNEGGSAEARATVTVSIPPAINLFTATPSCVMPGGSSVIRWNVANAASVTINGTPVNPLSGSMTVTPATDTTYTIAAIGSGCLAQTAQAQTTVAVGGAPQITQLTATPGTINEGESSVLQWRITGAVSATLNGQPINPSMGTLTVTPPETTTYTIVATSGGCSPQTTQSQVTVTVNTGPNPGSCPAITSFNASPSCVLPGQPATLSWAVTNSDTVTINGQSVNPSSGSISVTPTAATTTYTLVASRVGCPSQQVQVTVGMGSSPVINSFTAAPSSIQQNQSSTLSWSVTGAASVTIDGITVNPQAGQMTVTPPGTHTYTIVATGGGCSPQTVQSQVTVTVTSCPTISFFTATPTTIFQGGSSTLQWNVTNASAVTLNGSPVASSGSMTVTPGTTTTYRLLAQSASGMCDIERFVTITVSACSSPVVASFTANPSTVTPGGNQLVRLAWNVTDTTGTGLVITITPGVGAFNTSSGFVEITQPQVTTTYTLTAINACNSMITATVTVSVTPTCTTYSDPLPAAEVPPLTGPKILYFRSSREIVRPNEPSDPSAGFPWGDHRRVDFSWDTTGADNITINGVPVTVRGYGMQPYAANPLPSFPQFPTADTTYVLEAWHSSNPSYRVQVELPIKWKPEPHLFMLTIGSTENHVAGNTVQVVYSAGVNRWNMLDRSYTTVEIEGVATNLPPYGTINLTAGPTTREYKFIARRLDQTAVDYFTLMVEPVDNLGAGWQAQGWRNEAGWTLFPMGAGVRTQRLSNGALRIRPEFYGFIFTTSGGGTAGETGVPLIELYKDGVAIVEKYRLDQYVAGGWSVFGPASQTNIIPASRIPNAMCGRIDVMLSIGYSDLGSAGSNSNSYLTNRFIVDTRNGFVAPPGCPSQCLPTTLQLRNPWTQIQWNNE